MPESELPTEEQLERLAAAYERQPGEAYVELGEAYLALQRPRDAAQVGMTGLKARPNDMRGRLIMGRSFVMLHEWKRAQAELLRVVKADKRNRDGFFMLGEVLMRRQDYGRAVPVLQHAQNLDPANPRILGMLRRARAGQPLDPPPAIPRPLEPLSAEVGDVLAELDELPTRVAEAPNAEPTVVAPEPGEMFSQATGAPLRSSAPGGMRHQPPRPPPPVRQEHSGLPSLDGLPGLPRQAEHPPHLEAANELLVAAPPVRAGTVPEGLEPDPLIQSGTNVRPRVMSHQKPKDAAHASLRQSAAMGEDYLNNLLTAGLLDVPSVRVPDGKFDITPEKRWGRSTRKAFISLFALLTMLVAGGVFWYYRTIKQRDADVAKRLGNVAALVEHGTEPGFTKARREAMGALNRHKSNPLAKATVAQVDGLAALLYGIDLGTAERTTGAAKTALEDHPNKGQRQLTIAQVATLLAQLPKAGDDASEQLTLATSLVDTWLEEHSDDQLVQWLRARTHLAAGKRAAARALLRRLHETNTAPVYASIDLADMALDDGAPGEALALYEAALARSPKHPLAIVGMALAWGENSRDLGPAKEALNVDLDKAESPRLVGYKNLAWSFVSYALEEYIEFVKRHEGALRVNDPRFLARRALGYLRRGDIKQANTLRRRIRWAGSDPEPHPVVELVNAELFLALGKPEAAVAILATAKIDSFAKSLAVRRLRGRAYLDLGRASDAVAEFDAALALSEKDRESKLWREAARYISGSSSTRRDADKQLEELRLASKDKFAVYVRGYALAQRSRGREAKSMFEKSVDGVSDEFPNSLAYRAYYELARFALDAKKGSEAIELIEKSLEINPGYLPARALYGRALVGANRPDDALPHLEQVMSNPPTTWAEDLAYAEAVVASRSADDAARTNAMEAVRRAKDKGAPKGRLSIAWKLDPDQAEQLGAPKP